jgi:hypothetical protein
MDKISRRSFVKRSGAVTLGSVLGLGILPSVTRKLHATDYSQTCIQGVKVDWNSNSYSKTFPYGSGSLELGTALSCSVSKGVCSVTATVHILRYCVYRQTVGGVPCSASSYENAYYTYSCVDGAVVLSVEKGDGNGMQNVVGPGDQVVAAVQIAPSAGSPQSGPRGQVFQDATSSWGPEMALSAVGFTATCCSFS